MAHAGMTFADEEFWSVHDFARRYRLSLHEEKRLLSLFGPVALPLALLSNARRSLPGG